jgi:transcriptional repressor NrdR
MGRAEVTSEMIGNLVLDQLADVDQVAYIRFASVYLDLNDLSEIRSEIDRLMGRSALEAEG